MPFASILVLAFGLGMDAAAVSVARGVVAERVRLPDVLRVALLFGGFQALMPAIGWLLGKRWGAVFQAWDHWLAFGLLAALGVKMLRDARPAPAPRASPTMLEPRIANAFGFRVLLVLAIATSIDALAVGFTLPLLGAALLIPVMTIGVVTAAMSATGVLVGRRAGLRLGQRLDAVGGVVLIALGIKILADHLSAA